MSRSKRVVSLLLIVALAPSLAQADSGWGEHDRLYLLGSRGDFFYWSVDQMDTELNLASEERVCSTLILKGLPAREECTFLFLPGSLLEAPVKWNGSSPLRFHLDLEVVTRGEPSVTIGVQGGGANVQATATQTPQGAWEAAVTAPGQLDPASWSLITVTVESTVPLLTANLSLNGASYIDLPQPVRAAGVPQLMAQESPPSAPGRFDTAMRSFWFNDDRWRVESFQGDLSEMRDFVVPLERPAAAVIGWVEAFESGFTHDIGRGREPDARKATESFETDLWVNGDRVARGSSSGVYGVGTDSAAATDLPASALTLRVKPTPVWPTNVNHDYPYRAYVLVLEGQRTLARMTWPSMFGGYPGITATQAPLVGVCPGTPDQQVPLTAAVRSLAVDM